MLNFDYIVRIGVKFRCICIVILILMWLNYYIYMMGLYLESYGIVLNVFYDLFYSEWFIYESDCFSYDLKFYNDFELIWLIV